MSIWSLTYRQTYLSDSKETNISKSFTHKMAAKTSLHRYGTKLRHCYRMYTETDLFATHLWKLYQPAYFYFAILIHLGLFVTVAIWLYGCAGTQNARYYLRYRSVHNGHKNCWWGKCRMFVVVSVQACTLLCLCAYAGGGVGLLCKRGVGPMHYCE